MCTLLTISGAGVLCVGLSPHLLVFMMGILSAQLMFVFAAARRVRFRARARADGRSGSTAGVATLAPVLLLAAGLGKVLHLMLETNPWL